MNETTQTPATAAAEPVSPTSLDAETLFIDVTGRAWRLEDLPEAQRRAVLEAVAQSLEPVAIPSNAALLAASRALSRHVHDLPADRRVALVVAAAVAIDTCGSWVDQDRLAYREDIIRRLIASNQALVEALTASTEFNCRRLAHELTGRVVFAVTPKATTRRRRSRSTEKAVS